jgi:hypothetical protein
MDFLEFLRSSGFGGPRRRPMGGGYWGGMPDGPRISPPDMIRSPQWGNLPGVPGINPPNFRTPGFGTNPPQMPMPGRPGFTPPQLPERIVPSYTRATGEIPISDPWGGDVVKQG